MKNVQIMDRFQHRNGSMDISVVVLLGTSTTTAIFVALANPILDWEVKTRIPRAASDEHFFDVGNMFATFLYELFIIYVCIYIYTVDSQGILWEVVLSICLKYCGNSWLV